MQISLNTRQHILLNVGVRIPVSNKLNRKPQIAMYLLWDWFDEDSRWLVATHYRLLVCFALGPLCLFFWLASASVDAQSVEAQSVDHSTFATSDQCIACHSNLTDADGKDVSIGMSGAGP